jgi:hypothetical protein
MPRRRFSIKICESFLAKNEIPDRVAFVMYLSEVITNATGTTRQKIGMSAK